MSILAHLYAFVTVPFTHTRLYWYHSQSIRLYWYHSQSILVPFTHTRARARGARPPLLQPMRTARRPAASLRSTGGQCGTRGWPRKTSRRALPSCTGRIPPAHTYVCDQKKKEQKQDKRRNHPTLEQKRRLATLDTYMYNTMHHSRLMKPSFGIFLSSPLDASHLHTPHLQRSGRDKVLRFSPRLSAALHDSPPLFSLFDVRSLLLCRPLNRQHLTRARRIAAPHDLVDGDGEHGTCLSLHNACPKHFPLLVQANVYLRDTKNEERAERWPHSTLDKQCHTSST